MQSKILIYVFCMLFFLPNMLHAQSLEDCNKHLDELLHSPKYKVNVYEGKFVKNVILDSDTRRFRTRFREVLAINPKVGIAGQFGVTMWGCGSPCFNLGLVNLKTGKALIGPYYSYSVEYSPNSQIIITDRAESQEQVDLVTWITPQAYKVTADNKLEHLYQCKLERVNESRQKF